MAIYSVDVRDGMIRRVTQDCHKVNNKRCFLIEAGSGKQAWAKGHLCASSEWQRGLWLLPPPSL